MPHSNPSWLDRNIFIASLLKDNASIIDYGCGSKEFLNYYSPSEYLGIDQNPNADIIADLESYIPTNKQYDYGLILGVLEYLKSPFEFVEKVKHTADCFIILAFIKSSKKPEWTNHFTEDELLLKLKLSFDNVEVTQHNRYRIFTCR